MITVVLKTTSLPEKWDDKVLIFPELFCKEILVNRDLDNWEEAVSIGLGLLTGKSFSLSKPNKNGILVSIYEKEVFINGKKYGSGTLLLIGKNSREVSVPKTDINFYEKEYLGKIYLSQKERKIYMKKVQNSLAEYKKIPEWKQCPEKLFKLILLGKGCYGNVSKTTFNGLDIAVKISKIKKEGTRKAYDLCCTSWHEVYILDKILKPLILSGKCRNLPLLYETFTCKKCKLTLDDTEEIMPCVSTVIELADGDLKKYFSEKRSEQEILSCIFQVMAGLYSIQNFGQIMNFDIKKENILYYNVEKGGYFHYNILGKDYYVPNFGKLFIVNDFGVSRPMSPDFPLYKSRKDKTFRLGSRYAVIRGDIDRKSVV